ncbi:NusG antitermination factor [Synechococcus phage S-CRM01]|uniref:transcription antiterminator n=1 Tax=Synechococcus phage S-CRM01 TaxID=1026955 RepID=UPI000209E3A4|nr:transcription antiterminator [Synechococcus phage S-CRM01]AEC53050.1 NusG antitermination factor [Synechococcus phage S-CRM01]
MMNYKDWYCVQVAAGCEKKAMADLKARKSVLGDIFIQDVEVPQHTVVTVDDKGKKKSTKTNILPGYILVQVKKEKIETEEEGVFVEVFPASSHDIIRSTFNVLGFAGPDKKKPRVMPASEVRTIFSQVDDAYKETKTNLLADYKVGDKLTVINGPFEGKNIIVDSIRGDKVTAEVDMFGRITTVEFSKEQLLK